MSKQKRFMIVAVIFEDRGLEDRGRLSVFIFFEISDARHRPVPSFYISSALSNTLQKTITVLCLICLSIVYKQYSIIRKSCQLQRVLFLPRPLWLAHRGRFLVRTLQMTCIQHRESAPVLYSFK